MASQAQLLQILSVFFFIYSVNTQKLPASFKICKKNDPKIESCLQEAIQKAFPDMVQGIPKFGILPIDPLKITELKMGRTSGPVNLQMTFTNCEITGFSNGIVGPVKFDPTKPNPTMEATVSMPKTLVFSGDYDIHGKVLLVPIKEKGKCKMTFGPTVAKVFLKTVEYEDNGEVFIRAEDYDFTFTSEWTKFHFQPGTGNPKPVVNLNVFANENSKLLLEELTPAISKSLGTVFKDVTNKIFNKVPYKHILP